MIHEQAHLIYLLRVGVFSDLLSGIGENLALLEPSIVLSRVWRSCQRIIPRPTSLQPTWAA